MIQNFQGHFFFSRSSEKKRHPGGHSVVDNTIIKCSELLNDIERIKKKKLKMYNVFALMVLIFGIKNSHGDVLVYKTPNNQVNLF